MLVEGKQNKEIARNLSLSVQTIKKHLSEIFVILDVSTRGQAVSEYLKDSAPENETWGDAGGVTGFWISRFTFLHESSENGEVQVQFGLEQVTIEKGGLIVGRNFSALSERDEPYLHTYQISVIGDWASIEWRNRNSRYFGNSLLYIDPECNTMSGKYLGSSSDNEVSVGNWEFVRIIGLNRVEDLDSISRFITDFDERLNLRSPFRMTN